MTRNELNNEYFDWMCCLVQGDGTSYQRLLHYLHEIDFTYILPMDDNRAVDGIDLRYRFGDEMNYPEPMIATFLDDRPCSVLEMMVALSLRCEEHIMSDPDYGDRTGEWFWGMIKNLGLLKMTDSRFDGHYVDRVIDIFLNRNYSRDGKGGLFTVKDCKVDMRQLEIWCQLCRYLEEISNLEVSLNDS